MAHELNIRNGVASIMYVGQTPWHGLGQRLAKPATAAEAISAARLDYEVVKREVYCANGCGEFNAIKGKFATVRTDTDEALGVVGSGYAPIQNREAFGFMDALSGDGRVEYHTAGALRKGEVVWMLAKLPGVIRVRGTEDVTEKYLCLTNSHDGTATLKVWWTPVRVVCQNTLRAAMRNMDEAVSIRHSGDVAAKVGEAQRVLGLAVHYYDDLEGIINKLAGVQMNRAMLTKYVEEVFPAKAGKEVPAQTRTAREAVIAGMDAPTNRLEGIAGTAWAAYNALTEYVDHRLPIRARGADEKEARLTSIWFGHGARLKAKAWSAAIALAS